MVFRKEGEAWKAEGCSLTCSLEVNQEARPVVNLTDEAARQWEQFNPGKCTWELTTETLMAVDEEDPMDLLGKDVLLRTDIAKAGQPSGTHLREGMARCVEIAEGGTHGNMAKRKATFIGIGELRHA